MSKNQSKVMRTLLWLLALGWIGVLFFFSGQTGDESAGLSLKVTEYVLRIFPWLPFTVEELHPVLRKLAHFCVFGLEGFLLGLAMMHTLPGRRRGGILAVAACAGLAALNEYHQFFTAGRSCELRDVLIDSAGAAVGVLAAAVLLVLHGWVRRRSKNVIIS